MGQASLKVEISYRILRRKWDKSFLVCRVTFCKDYTARIYKL